jgi:hypothetical protein
MIVRDRFERALAVRRATAMPIAAITSIQKRTRIFRYFRDYLTVLRLVSESDAESLFTTEEPERW